MDDSLRRTELDARKDDPRALDAYAAAQIRSGNFWAERVIDGYLGDAWKFWNLPVNDQTWNLTYSFYSGDAVDRKTTDQYLEMSLAGAVMNIGGKKLCSMLLQASIDTAMAEHRADKYLAPRVLEYRENRSQRFEQTTGRMTKLDGLPGFALFEEISLDGRLNAQTIRLPHVVTIPLAHELQEAEYGTAAEIQMECESVIIQLFGRNYERAIPAMQYWARRGPRDNLRYFALTIGSQFSMIQNSVARSIQLCTPIGSESNPNPGMGINFYDATNRPTRGALFRDAKRVS